MRFHDCWRQLVYNMKLCENIFFSGGIEENSAVRIVRFCLSRLVVLLFEWNLLKLFEYGFLNQCGPILYSTTFNYFLYCREAILKQFFWMIHIIDTFGKRNFWQMQALLYLQFLPEGLSHFTYEPISTYWDIHDSKMYYIISINVCEVKVAQSCPTLCDPTDCSPPGSSVHGILQARVPEWVSVPFSRGIFPTQGSNLGLLNCRQILYCLSHQGRP